MADHLPVFLLNYTGVWTDVTTSVAQGDPFKVNIGGGEISDSLKPTKVDITLEDPDGVYRPYLATSPLYGLAGRNTPLLAGYDVLTETFESAGLAITVGAGSGVNPWARSTTSPHTGAWCFKSGAAADSAVSDAVITAPAGATMCVLWYRTDCSSTDRLLIFVGDDIRYSFGGTAGVWTQLTVPILANAGGTGNKVLYLRYAKDASGSAGADAVYVDDLRFIAARGAVEVSSWRPDRTLGFQVSPRRGRQSTDVTAEGLLRRLGAWTEPIRSAYTRQILSNVPNLIDFWPFEDLAGVQPANLVAGGQTGIITIGQTGDDSSPGGGSTSATLPYRGQIGVTFAPISTPGYQIAFSFKIPSTSPLTGTYLYLLTWNDRAGYSFLFGINSGAYEVLITDRNGSTVMDDTVTWGAEGRPDVWCTHVITISGAGGTVSFTHKWFIENGSTVYTSTNSYSGPQSIPRGAGFQGYQEFDGTNIGYLYLTTSTGTDLTAGGYTNAFNGYLAETVGTRFLRLMLEAGLQASLIGTAAKTEPMGPQRPDTLLKLLQELRDTDGGAMYDSTSEVGVTYRARHTMYARTAVLALTYGTNVAAPLMPVLDDANTHNSVTVTNRAGGSATVTDTTSSMGTAAPPAGVGLYKQEIAVNVSSVTRLENVAAWWKNIGTVPDARYSSVTLDLDANPSLELTARTIVPGDRITIAALDLDTVDLMVIGVADLQRTQKRYTMTFLCVPYRQYNVAIYDNTARRYDSKTSTLNAGYSAVASPMVVTFLDPMDAWSQTNTPYDWVVAGERIRVTAMGAPVGAGPYTQSATVTRSINGAGKVHVAGEPVHMHPDQQARYAL